MNVYEELEKIAVLPAVALDDAAKAVPLAEALLAGGIDLMEITFRTAAAAESIRLVREKCPAMLVGAGTVNTLDQAKQALAMGAQFIVSPGYSAAIVEYCLEQNVPVVPACTTGTEIMTALNAGLTLVKFFPAEANGGVPMMKALNGPFPMMRFLPTGGVNAKNLQTYLGAKFVFAVGGTWLTPKEALAEGDFAKVTALCKEALELKRAVRP